MTATIASEYDTDIWWLRPEPDGTLGPREDEAPVGEQFDMAADPNADQYAGYGDIPYPVLARMVNQIIAQRDHPGEVRTFLRTPEGRQILREQMVHEMDEDLVQRVIAKYFKTDEGRDYIESIVVGDGTVAHLAKVAATEKTELWLEGNLTERVERILRAKGVVRHKAKWLWGFFGMIACIALVMCFNWLFYAAPQDVDILGIRLVSSEAVAYCRSQIAPIVALITVLSMLYVVCVGLLSSSSGRHCQKKRSARSARSTEMNTGSKTDADVESSSVIHDDLASHDSSQTATNLRHLTGGPRGRGRRRRTRHSRS